MHVQDHNRFGLSMIDDTGYRPHHVPGSRFIPRMILPRMILCVLLLLFVQSRTATVIALLCFATPGRSILGWGYCCNGISKPHICGTEQCALVQPTTLRNDKTVRSKAAAVRSTCRSLPSSCRMCYTADRSWSRSSINRSFICRCEMLRKINVIQISHPTNMAAKSVSHKSHSGSMIYR